MSKFPSSKPSYKAGPPGSRLKKLAERNQVIRNILHHTDVLQIIEDHQAMWLYARDAAERRHIERRFRRQLALVLVNWAGFETAVHGAISTVTGYFFHGGFLILIGIALQVVSRVKHKDKDMDMDK